MDQHYENGRARALNDLAPKLARFENSGGVGWVVEDSRDRVVFGPVSSEAEARKKLKDLGGDAKGYVLGYSSEYSEMRAHRR